MAIIALHSAATGLKALSQQLDVISNNIANANTPGLTPAELTYAVQLFLSRIVFLRICEDRDIDTGSKLQSIVDTWRKNTGHDENEGQGLDGFHPVASFRTGRFDRTPQGWCRRPDVSLSMRTSRGGNQSE